MILNKKSSYMVLHQHEFLHGSKTLVVIRMILSKQYSCLGFFSCISSQMDLQNRLFRELFCAKRSAVWFFSCEFSNSFMNTHMSHMSREWFWATRADVWLISCMNTSMALSIRLSSEWFWTKRSAAWYSLMWVFNGIFKIVCLQNYFEEKKQLYGFSPVSFK